MSAARRNGENGDNGDGALVDGVAKLNRSLATIAVHLVDVGVALVTVNVMAGPQGSPTTNAALNDLHAAQDEVFASSRAASRLLEGVRVRAGAAAK